jgi:hypothetical protein
VVAAASASSPSRDVPDASRLGAVSASRVDLTDVYRRLGRVLCDKLLGVEGVLRAVNTAQTGMAPAPFLR